REAQAAGTLSHPNIVTVHDIGEEDETSFIAMEYVEGKNLKQVIRGRERLSFDRIAEIIAQVADALDYAHRKGIVHRDVKPANIIITPDGAVKITDFGIAKIETSSLTETGQFLGTPNYMSPEQVTGEIVDGRSDLFSLGVVLYELLTGKKPFLGDNVTSISYKIVHEDFPGLESAAPGIPADFSPILAKALAKDPAARFERGADFSRALYELRARQAEYQMIRDLGEMVARAEKLGPVAPVEAPPGGPTTAATRLPGAETTARLGAPSPGAPEVKDSLEALARRRDDLNPQLVNLAAATNVDSSGPDWSLDTDALKKPAPREPVPSSPGTLISEIPRVPRKVAGETAGASEGAAHRNPAPAPRADQPPLPPGEDGAGRAGESPRPEARPPGRPAPSLETSGLVRAAERSAPIRRPAPVMPPSLPLGAGPGPRPPALPPDTTGSLRRFGSPQYPPVPSPRERAAGVRVEPAAGTAKEWTGPLKLETPPAPPTKEGNGPAWVEALPAVMEEVTTRPKPEPAAAEPPAGETPEGVLRREVRRRWAWAIVALVIAPVLSIVVLLYVQARQIVPRGDQERRAAGAAMTEKRNLLEEGNRYLAEGKFEEAKKSFLELTRRAPESVAAREALQDAERRLARKAERDRLAAEVAAHLAAARTARGGADLAAVVAEADAALAIEPDQQEALALRRAAGNDIRRLPKPQQRKIEARLRTLRAKMPLAPAPSAPAASVAALGAAGPSLRVAFRSPFDAGTLFVRLNDKEILRRAFEFDSGKGGLVEANVELSASSGELRAWLFSADGSVRSYGVLRMDRAEGERRLVLGLDGGQRLSMALE
ncbi:MAG: protein kinase domain-containing protein, partial [Acidithiobacillales bacterium]